MRRSLFLNTFFKLRQRGKYIALLYSYSTISLYLIHTLSSKLHINIMLTATAESNLQHYYKQHLQATKQVLLSSNKEREVKKNPQARCSYCSQRGVKCFQLILKYWHCLSSLIAILGVNRLKEELSDCMGKGIVDVIGILSVCLPIKTPRILAGCLSLFISSNLYCLCKRIEKFHHCL